MSSERVRHSHKPGVNRDYDNLPRVAKVEAPEICAIENISMTTLNARVEEGTYPKPHYVGRKRMWFWGEVKDELLKAGENKTPPKRKFAPMPKHTGKRERAVAHA